MFPAHVIVLALLAFLALFAAQDAESAFRAGEEAKAFTAEVRRAVAFGLLFNLSIGLALVLGWLLELGMTVVRLFRKSAPAGRSLARLGLALVPLLVFVVGHRLLNPWLPDLLRQVGSLARGG